MYKQVVIIGASGHGKVIADIIEKKGDIVFGFLDDDKAKIGKHIINSYEVIGSIKDSIKLLSENEDLQFIIGIGDNEIRKKIAEQYNLPYYTAIHPTANIGTCVNIEEGTAIMANACINVCAHIGKHSIINTGAIIEHDNELGEYVHISPNATLAGNVQIGELTHIGVGATVKNNINIEKKCIVGAGAVVVKNIEKSGTYVGVPARLMKG